MPRLAIAALALLFFASGPSQAHDYQVGDLQIDHPWTRVLPAVSKNAALYMTIRNDGTEADRLVELSSPAGERAEIHESLQDDQGVMRMRHREAAEIPPGGSLALQPGGYHVMLIGLKAPLEEGQRLPLTLTFERAGEVEVEVAVGAPGEDSAAHDHGHDHGAEGAHEGDGHGHE